MINIFFEKSYRFNEMVSITCTTLNSLIPVLADDNVLGGVALNPASFISCFSTSKATHSVKMQWLLCAQLFLLVSSELLFPWRYQGDHESSRIIDIASSSQRQLSTPDTTTPFKRGSFTRVAQDSRTCDTYGERQWAGTVDISDERSLFYWLFESRNKPNTDPIIIWLNGCVSQTCRSRAVANFV